MAVGTSKKINNTPSMIMPPAMPKTPETNEAMKTARPMAASAASDIGGHACQSSVAARTK